MWTFENFSIVSYKQEMRKRPLHAEKPQMEINSFEKLNHEILIHTWSEIAFKDTVDNRARSKVLLHGKLLAVAFTLLTYWKQFSLGGICKNE